MSAAIALLSGTSEAAGRPGTLADSVYAATRADILACRLRPGAKIRMADLCTRFDVSLGAVREALSRLAAERLVSSEAQRGFRVATVSVEDLRDLTLARIEIETVCLRRSIANGGVEWEASIVAAAHRLSKTPERGDADGEVVSERWLEAHETYHETLVAACDSNHLLRMRKQLYQQAERYRLLAMLLGRGLRNIEAEHSRITRSVIRRDSAAATEIMGWHISRSAEIITEAMSGAAGFSLPEVRTMRRGELSEAQ